MGERIRRKFGEVNLFCVVFLTVRQELKINCTKNFRKRDLTFALLFGLESEEGPKLQKLIRKKKGKQQAEMHGEKGVCMRKRDD